MDAGATPRRSAAVTPMAETSRTAQRALPATPEDFPRAFAAAWMARDAEALAALFAPDADFVNVAGLWWEDRGAIRAAHHRALTGYFAASRLVTGRTKVRALGPGLAAVHQRFLLTGQRLPDGTEGGRRTTVILFVIRDTGAGWQGVVAQNTDVATGAETMAAGPLGLAPARYD